VTRTPPLHRLAWREGAAADSPSAGMAASPAFALQLAGQSGGRSAGQGGGRSAGRGEGRSAGQGRGRSAGQLAGESAGGSAGGSAGESAGTAAAAAEFRAAHAGTGTQTIALLLADIDPSARLWGYNRFLIGRSAARRLPGLQFVKVLGSGHDGGFGLRPSASRQGLFCLFEQAEQAHAFLERSSLVADYRAHAREFLSVLLRAYSSRGSWSGKRFEITASEPQHGPIAGLTRASIKPHLARAFWRRAPPAERSLDAAPGCLLAAGLGEAPLLRQATFTVWESAAAMDAYAHSGAHLDAIRASRDGGYFSESMFTRFVPEALQGVWKGRRYG